MYPPALRATMWLFSRLVPKDLREPLMGDLAEEYATREKVTSSLAALRWALREIFASVPPMLWIRLLRATWIATLAVALLAFIVTNVVDFLVLRAMPRTPDGRFAPHPLGVVVVLLAVGLIGYFAERLRCRAAAVLGIMMLLVETAMTLMSEMSSPLWFRVAWFFLGPAAALGGILYSLRRSRT